MEIQKFEWKDFSFLREFLAFSDYQDCHTRDEISNDRTQYSTENPKTEILQLEVNSVVMENY